MDGEWVEVAHTKFQAGRLLVLLAGYRDRTRAETLRGRVLEAKAEPPELAENEFRVVDLIGCTVEDKGCVVGIVDAVDALPGQDLLIVGEVMIPFVSEFVKSVDVQSRRILVELIPGMLPGDSE